MHGVPFAAIGLLHAPVALSQVPATWHGSDAAQTIGEPAQTPAWQTSTRVQALPSLQAMPFAAGGLLHWPVA